MVDQTATETLEVEGGYSKVLPNYDKLSRMETATAGG